MAFAAPVIPVARDPVERLQQAGVVRRARYVGFLRGAEYEVWACTLQGLTRLCVRRELISLSPIAFGWADSGPGPFHVAGAVLSHWSGGDDFALRHYHDFAEEVICRLTDTSWELTSSVIAQAIARIVTRKKNSRLTRSRT